MATRKNKGKEIWIGLLEVKPRPGCEYLGNAKGAFVNIVTWARNKGEFRRKAKTLTAHLNMKLVGIEDPEPLSKRQRHWTVSRKIRSIASRVKANPNAIIYSDFHIWRQKKQRKSSS